MILALKGLQAMIFAGILVSTRGKLRHVPRTTQIVGHRMCVGHVLSQSE